MAIAALGLLLAGGLRPCERRGAKTDRRREEPPVLVPAQRDRDMEERGPPDAMVKPAVLVLLFDAINIDEGTARLRNGSVGSELIARLSGGYLHFIQQFRTGPLYMTTVFDKETTGGKLKAVHSRHEYFGAAGWRHVEPGAVATENARS